MTTTHRTPFAWLDSATTPDPFGFGDQGRKATDTRTIQRAVWKSTTNDFVILRVVTLRARTRWDLGGLTPAL